MAMPQPLAATTGTPGGPPEPEVPDFDMSQVPTEHLTKMFQDPKFLAQSAMVFLKHGQPQGLAWLERAHGAAKENAFEALQRLEMDDGDGAVEAFNRSGRYTDATGAVKNADGTWTLTRKNGQTQTLNPTAIRRSLLSPAEYFRQEQEERRTRVTEKNADTNERYRQDQADIGREANADRRDYQRRLTDNAAERTEMMGEVANARTQAAQAAAQARAESARERAELNNRYGPMALYNKLVETDPERAEKELAKHPDVVAVVGKSGAVGLFPSSAFNDKGEPTGRPLRTYASGKEYEALTGRKLPAAEAPAKGPAAPEKAKTQGLVQRMLAPSRGLSQVLDEAPPEDKNVRRLRQREADDEYLRQQGAQY